MLQHPWSYIAVDFVITLPYFHGHTMILVIINCFSKACRVVPLKGLSTAIEMAKAIFHYIFQTYGLLEDIQGNPVHIIQ